MNGLNTLDFILLGVIGLFTLWGLFRGLFKEVVSTLGIGLAYWVSNTYNEALAPFFSNWMSDPAIMHAAAYLALFVGTNLGVMIVSWILARAFRLTPPALIEFLGGALFGSAKGVLISAVVLICLAAFLPKAEFVQQSRVGGYLKPVTQWLARYMPDRMRNFDPSVLGRRLQDEKGEYMKNFLQGSDKPDKPGKKDEKGDQGKGSEMEQVDKMVKSLEEQAGQIQDLLNQGKK
ncbi:MAG: CvpA family protein [Thermodesulfobacteriota bacterium]